MEGGGAGGVHRSTPAISLVKRMTPNESERRQTMGQWYGEKEKEDSEDQTMSSGIKRRKYARLGGDLAVLMNSDTRVHACREERYPHICWSTRGSQEHAYCEILY